MVFVYRTNSGGTPVAFAGESAGSSASESVTFKPLQTGANYAMFVDVFAAPGGDGSPLTVMPTRSSCRTAMREPDRHTGLTVGDAGEPGVTLNWTGLVSGRYLGIVNYNDERTGSGHNRLVSDNQMSTTATAV